MTEGNPYDVPTGRENGSPDGRGHGAEREVQVGSVRLESCAVTDALFGGLLDAGTIPWRLLMRDHSLSRR